MSERGMVGIQGLAPASEPIRAGCSLEIGRSAQTRSANTAPHFVPPQHLSRTLVRGLQLQPGQGPRGEIGAPFQGPGMMLPSGGGGRREVKSRCRNSQVPVHTS